MRGSFLAANRLTHYVLNFGRPTLKEGIDRVILDSEGGNRGIGLARIQT